MFKNNDRLRDVMLATAISGLVATIAYVIIFNLAIQDENIKLMAILGFSPLALMPAWYLIIGYGFKWKFGKERSWVASLCSLPFIFEVFVVAIIGDDFMETFLSWYPMIGITISVLIFEYKFMTHGKKKVKSNVKVEMIASINSFMSKYSRDKQGDVEDVAYIFARARQTVNSLRKKELSKELRTNGITADFGALNILHACAMAEIKYVPLADAIINRDNSGPYDLYNAVNKEKLNKGYISKQQYEENENVGNTLRFVPNGSLWL